MYCQLFMVKEVGQGRGTLRSGMNVTWANAVVFRCGREREGYLRPTP